MRDGIQINDKGFVRFSKRNFGYAGDKASYAKVENGKLIVARAKKGMMSSDYEDEIREFCESYGIDWDSVGCGDRVSVEIQ